MAKIGTWTYKINQEIVEFKIYYTSSKGFFARGIPSDVLAFQKKPSFGFDTEAELRKFLREAIDTYHEKTKKSRKVIAYILKLTTCLSMNKVEQGHYSGTKPWLPSDYSPFNYGLDGGGHGFSIKWKILMEVKARDIEYYRINDDGTIGYRKNNVEHDYLIIDWTPEREEAFKDIDRSLEEMVKRLAGTLCNTKKMTELIDNNIKLLGG